MEQIGITGVQAILVVSAIAGVIELVKRVFDKDWRAVAIIIAAGITGGLISLFPEMNFSFLVGVVGGLAASGAITIGQNIGKDAMLA